MVIMWMSMIGEVEEWEDAYYTNNDGDDAIQ